MANATTTVETNVSHDLVGITLHLSPDEAEHLLNVLTGWGALSDLRSDNPLVYDITHALDDELSAFTPENVQSAFFAAHAA